MLILNYEFTKYVKANVAHNKLKKCRHGIQLGGEAKFHFIAPLIKPIQGEGDK